LLQGAGALARCAQPKKAERALCVWVGGRVHRRAVAALPAKTQRVRLSQAPPPTLPTKMRAPSICDGVEEELAGALRTAILALRMCVMAARGPEGIVSL
jgi:hypothetical protein